MSRARGGGDRGQDGYAEDATEYTTVPLPTGTYLWVTCPRALGDMEPRRAGRLSPSADIRIL